MAQRYRGTEAQRFGAQPLYKRGGKGKAGGRWQVAGICATRRMCNSEKVQEEESMQLFVSFSQQCCCQETLDFRAKGLMCRCKCEKGEGDEQM